MPFNFPVELGEHASNTYHPNWSFVGQRRKAKRSPAAATTASAARLEPATRDRSVLVLGATGILEVLPEAVRNNQIFLWPKNGAASAYQRIPRQVSTVVSHTPGLTDKAATELTAAMRQARAADQNVIWFQPFTKLGFVERLCQLAEVPLPQELAQRLAERGVNASVDGNSRSGERRNLMPETNRPTKTAVVICADLTIWPDEMKKRPDVEHWGVTELKQHASGSLSSSITHVFYDKKAVDERYMGTITRLIAQANLEPGRRVVKVEKFGAQPLFNAVQAHFTTPDDNEIIIAAPINGKPVAPIGTAAVAFHDQPAPVPAAAATVATGGALPSAPPTTPLNHATPPPAVNAIVVKFWEDAGKPTVDKLDRTALLALVKSHYPKRNDAELRQSISCAVSTIKHKMMNATAGSPPKATPAPPPAAPTLTPNQPIAAAPIEPVGETGDDVISQLTRLAEQSEAWAKAGLSLAADLRLVSDRVVKDRQLAVQEALAAAARAIASLGSK